MPEALRPALSKHQCGSSFLHSHFQNRGSCYPHCYQEEHLPFVIKSLKPQLAATLLYVFNTCKITLMHQLQYRLRKNTETLRKNKASLHVWEPKEIFCLHRKGYFKLDAQISFPASIFLCKSCKVLPRENLEG